VNADDFNWRLACVCIEDQHEFWNRKDVKMKAILRKDIHYAAVDGVHLMNVSISLSGGKIFFFCFQLCCLVLGHKKCLANWQKNSNLSSEHVKVKMN